MKLKILKASRAACLCTTIGFAVVPRASLADPQELITGAVGALHRAQAAEGDKRAAHLEAALEALKEILRDYPESELAAQIRGAGVSVFGGDSISIESVQRELGLPTLRADILDAAVATTRAALAEEEHDRWALSDFFGSVSALLVEFPDAAANFERIGLDLVETGDSSGNPTGAYFEYILENFYDSSAYFLASVGNMDAAMVRLQSELSEQDVTDRTISSYTVAKVMARKGQPQLARKVAKNVPDISDVTAQSDYLDVTTVFEMRAEVLLILGEFEAAVSVFEHIDAERVELLGGSICTAKFFPEAAFAAADFGDVEKTQAFFDRSHGVEDRCGYYSSDAIYFTIANSLWGAGEIEAAEMFSKYVESPDLRISLAGRKRDPVRELLTIEAGDFGAAFEDFEQALAGDQSFRLSVRDVERLCTGLPKQHLESIFSRLSEKHKRGEVRDETLVRGLIACERPDDAMRIARNCCSRELLKRARLMVEIAIAQ